MSIYSGTNADHPYDYSYDYAISINGRVIVCDTVGDNEFRLLIYGDAVDPRITIGGKVYAIHGTLQNGETLLIDSINKTITLTTSSGSRVNWFDKRSREHDIFAPIASGQNPVYWNGDFAFELTVIEKRSEPKWT